MTNVYSAGEVPWTRDEMIASLEEFVSIYRNRPIADNTGGMKAPHMFLTWFAMRKLRPAAIIESGIWLGQGTWLLEQACPEAQLYCIDPILDRLRYRSERAQYLKEDFARTDWNHLPKEETVVFFDDHQNAYERVKTASWLGFKQMMFEDNYPPSQGDVYSLKRVLMGAGFTPPPERTDTPRALARKIARRLLGQKKPRRGEVAPNRMDAIHLKANTAVYCELPPVFKTPLTRWNDPWEDDTYPTPEPLLKSVEKPWQQVYWDEAQHYTWICYLRLR